MKHQVRNNQPFTYSLYLVILSLCLLAFLAPTGIAATLTVNSLGDNGNGTCGVDTCTLRDAIMSAANDGEPTVIVFQPGLQGTIVLQQGELLINVPDLDIQGPGPDLITVSGNNASRVFHIFIVSNVSLSGLTIADGNIASGYAAGVYSRGDNIVLDKLRVINNTTSFIGAGVTFDGSSGSIRNSEISGNVATRGSGLTINGISGDHVLVENVTISGNVGNQAESGLNVLTSPGQTVTIRYVTVSNNTGSPRGTTIGGNGQEIIESSIFYGHNQHQGQDLNIHSESMINNSIIGDTLSNLNGENNLVGLDPMLLPLDFYAGSSLKVHALANGQSIAVDIVDDLVGDAQCGLLVTRDQLFQPRPVNGRCDAGAFELPFIPSDPPILTPIGNQNIDEFQTLNFTASASETDTHPNDLAFTLSGEPAGATITPDGVFNFTPTESQVGPFIFDVMVSDDGFPMNIDQETITVSVNEINQPPNLNLIANQTVKEAETLQFIVTANDADIPVQNLVFSMSNAPTGAALSTDGFFTFTPNGTQGAQDYVVEITVTDDAKSPLSDSQEVTITVEDDADLIFIQGFD